MQGTLSVTGDAAGRLQKAVQSMVEDLASAGASAGTVVQGSAYTPMTGPVAPGTARPNMAQQPMVGPVAPGQQRPTVLTAQPAPTGPVAAALAAYLNERKKKLESMAARTANAINGAAQATNAYQQGNLQMAQDAQAKVLRAPEKIDLPGGNGQGRQVGGK